MRGKRGLARGLRVGKVLSREEDGVLGCMDSKDVLGHTAAGQQIDDGAIGLAEVVLEVRTLPHADCVGIRSAVRLGAITDPEGIARDGSGFTPIGGDGPGAIIVAADRCAGQEFGEFIRDEFGLHHGSLLVEDAVLFDEVGGGIADDPSVVAGAGVGTLFVANNRAERTGLVAFDAPQMYEAVGADGDSFAQEIRDTLVVGDAESVFLLASFLTDKKGLFHRFLPP